MPIKFVVSRSDVTLEAGYQSPRFDLFRDDRGLFARLLDRLSPHGLKLSEMKVERGSGSLGDLHLFFYLVDYLVIVRIRVDRTEIYCSLLTAENKKRVIAAALDTFGTIRETLGVDFRAYAVGMNIHGLTEDPNARAFLAKLVSAPPAAAGATTGNGVAYYFASLGERIASSLTFDVSTVAPDGLFARPQATWDASRLPLEQLPERAEEFVRGTLRAFDIEMP